MSYYWAFSLVALPFVVVPIGVYLVMKFILCPNVKTMDLHHKHVFITGGSKGIGRALALEFCRRGASVTIVARNALQLAATCQELQKTCDEQNAAHGLKQGDGQEARSFALDLTKGYNAITSVVVEAERVLGPIDVLVNNAGNVMYQGAIEDASELAFERAFQLNVVGALQLCKAIVPSMKRRRTGRVVFVSSAAGCTFGMDGWMLGCVTAGAAPEPSAWNATMQCLFASVFRIVILGYQRHFAGVIAKLHREKQE